MWNTIPDSDTGITPFEAEHGMKCRGIAESIMENPPREGLPASADDLRTTAISARAFQEILRNVKAVENHKQQLDSMRTDQARSDMK